MNLYEQIGGESAVATLCRCFYQVMQDSQTTQAILAMHPSNLASSEKKLFLFLSGWLGGPNLYIEKYGHPRLRARHLPFSIGVAERDQWLYCMSEAIASLELEPTLSQTLYTAFADLADFMRNQHEQE